MPSLGHMSCPITEDNFFPYILVLISSNSLSMFERHTVCLFHIVHVFYFHFYCKDHSREMAANLSRPIIINKSVHTWM